MRSATVKLGGQQYTIEALPIRQSKEWREKLAVPFHTITRALETASVVEINQFGDIADLVRRFSGTLLSSVDIMLDLLFDYSPVLAADRERIEAEAYDDEALEAFAEALKLAYPLDRLGMILRGGSPRTITSSNSPTKNGASGRKTSASQRTT